MREGRRGNFPPCAYRTTMAGASWYMLADRDPRRKISDPEYFFSLYLALRKNFKRKFFPAFVQKKYFFPKKTDFLKILHLSREFSKILVFLEKNFSASAFEKKFLPRKFLASQKFFGADRDPGNFFPIRSRHKSRLGRPGRDLAARKFLVAT